MSDGVDEDKIPRRLDEIPGLEDAEETAVEAHDDLLRWCRRLTGGLFGLLGPVIVSLCTGVWDRLPSPFADLFGAALTALPITIVFVAAVGFALDGTRDSRRWFVGAALLAAGCFTCFGCLGILAR